MPADNEDKPATKTDITRLSLEIVKNAANTDKKTETLQAEVHSGFDRVIKTIDSFVGKLETYERESITIPKTLDAHGDKLREHEKRLDSLEAKA
ncbi:MAG: hypothetical protein HY400_00245 [Elusimicrobia bacterium]|nr:hypothetical protein [Elusimicrobiota bacterium]